MKVYDLNGKLIYMKRGVSNANYQFGEQFISGMYLAEFKQGEQKTSLKLIKQ